MVSRMDNDHDRKYLGDMGEAIGFGRCIQILQQAWNAVELELGRPARFKPDGSLNVSEPFEDEPAPEDQFCQGCRFFRDTISTRTCRRLPPVPGTTFGGWSTVDRYDWCGSWEPKA